MTITFVRGYQNQSATNGTAVSLTITVAPAAGDLIFCAISASTNDTIPTPAGWTVIGSQTLDTTNVAFFFKRAALGTETTVAVTLAVSGAWNIHYMQFHSDKGLIWTAGVVAKNVPQLAGTALLAGTTAITQSANALAIAAVTGAGARQTPSWNNTFVSNAGTASATTVFFLESAYKILTTRATQSATDTVSVSVASGWTGQIITVSEPGVVGRVVLLNQARNRSAVR